MEWKLNRIKNLLQYVNPIAYVFDKDLRHIDTIEFKNSMQVRGFLDKKNIKEVIAFDEKWHLVDLLMANGNSLHFEWI